MKKERNSDLHEALQSIINERKPATDNWQQSVLATLAEEKPRQVKPRKIIWWRGVAAAAAVAAVIITATLLHKAPQPESASTYSEVVIHAIEPKNDPQPADEPLPPSEPEEATATKPQPKLKPKPETQPVPELIVIVDTDYLADSNSPDPDSDLMPDEWIESLLASELTNRYISMISMLETEEEETSNTPEL